MGILPGPLQDPCESEELVRSSTSGAKTALFLFNLRFDDRPDPHFQHLGVDFTREAEKCNTSNRIFINNILTIKCFQ